MEKYVKLSDVEEMIKSEMPERGMWEIEGDREKETVCEVCIDLMQKLSGLPSVKHARWDNGICTNCGMEKPIVSVYRGGIIYRYKGELNYCPNCGAEMSKVNFLENFETTKEELRQMKEEEK